MDAFCIGRLRFIRLPPSWISLQRSSSNKPQTINIELAIGATDDYGTDLQFDSVDLKLELLDATTLAPVRGVQLRPEGSSTSRTPESAQPATAVFSFSPAQGPIHKLKLSLTFLPTFLASNKTPTSLVFALSVAPAVGEARRSSSSFTTGPVASSSTTALRNTIGEPRRPVIKTWDDRKFVLMSLRSGPVEIRIEKEPARVAQEKVQTAIRTVHLSSNPASEPQAASPREAAATIAITERPGLNNSTGQRLWDCAIGLTSFLSQYPAALDPNFALDGLLEEEGGPDQEHSRPPPAKRARQDVTVSSRPRLRGRLRVVELGAGCALASMVAAKLLSSPSASGAEQTAAATILATDVETTVESTLEENLRANGLLSSSNKKISDQSSNAKPPPIMIDSAVLDWGRLSDDQVRVVFGHPRQESRRLNGVADTRDDPALTILATDVLYNPESHPLLLATLLSLLRPTRARSQDDGSPLPRRALVTYKRRTEGDDGFFPLAREAGLAVDKVWEWGEVGVWTVT
ncbi:hypothetical protein C6P46_002919 [Rhodotorula mucilaginosa]|uniref:VMP4 protein n=1 Tax=Rhodotorula mucilaginosa TaxID=5537 RepID=A0A9P6W5F2_RHOMI|nr:hypothetical protein C6P46_002919 [Rhodotorula mucilaginosa]